LAGQGPPPLWSDRRVRFELRSVLAPGGTPVSMSMKASHKSSLRARVGIDR